MAARKAPEDGGAQEGRAHRHLGAKVAVGCIVVLAVLIGAGTALLGNSLVDFALVTQEGKTARSDNSDQADLAAKTELTAADAANIAANTEKLNAKRDAWLAGIDVERVTMKSADGRFDLAGFIYPAEAESKAWAVLIHGYTGAHAEMEAMAAYYAGQGYNVLAPDLRAQGDSQGDFIGMGWTDHADILAWTGYLAKRYGADIEVVLHGHSMGAATALIASGSTALPPQVMAVVSDCAYTSAWDMFSAQVNDLFPMIPSPLALSSANLMLQVRGGYDLEKASPLDAVARSRVPTLFIHGDRDTFIPASMTFSLFEASAAPGKDILIVDAAGHTQSELAHPQLYFNTVFAFLDGKVDAA